MEDMIEKEELNAPAENAENTAADGEAPEPENAYAEIILTTDHMLACLLLHEAKNGGEDITEDAVRAALEEYHVVYGIDEAALAKALEKKPFGIEVEVAHGTPPENGENGRIDYFFECGKTATPFEHENGDVDYKDLGTITNIIKGTPIGKIVPPTEGKSGTNVYGAEVKAERVYPARLAMGKGTVLSPDETMILADVDGNLVFKGAANGFAVEEDFTIKGDVGVSTGNIDFIGNIIVQGNVAEGFRVTSKKNITVKGAAAGAELRADGNIEIKLGCLQSNVDCKGNFKADFCEGSTIKCAKDVEANSFIGCEIMASGNIIASGKGVIAGGKYTSLKNITASAVGSDKYVKTEIVLGNNAILSRERDSHVKAIEEMETEIEQLTKLLSTLDEFQKKGGTLDERKRTTKNRALKSKLVRQNDIKNLTKRIEQIDIILEAKQDLALMCKKQLFPGTMVCIDSLSINVTAEYGTCKVTPDGGEIKILSGAGGK